MPYTGTVALYKLLFIEPKILDDNFNVVEKNKKNVFYELKENICMENPAASDLLFMEFPYTEYGERFKRFTIIDKKLAGEEAVKILVNYEWKSAPKRTRPSEDIDKIIDLRGYIISNDIEGKDKYLHWFILHKNNQPYIDGYVVHHRKQRFDNRMTSICRMTKGEHDSITGEDEKDDLLEISTTPSGKDLNYLLSIKTLLTYSLAYKTHK